MKKIILPLVVLAFLVLSFACVWGQKIEQEKTLLTGPAKFSSYSLLNPDKIDLHHSYSFLYLSNSKGSVGLGVYSMVLDYRISSPLSLRLGFSYLHEPLGWLGNRANLNLKQSILPSFELRYAPSDKFLLLLGFSTLPNPYLFQTE